jgi:uncharacterized protein YhhL (DUF1145 family)
MYILLWLCCMYVLVDVRDDYRVWIFIVFQYFVFVCMGIFSIMVDDIPEEVNISIYILYYITTIVLHTLQIYLLIYILN